MLLLIGKSVVAATAGWIIANDVLAAPSATFAPFAALLMVQATISESLDRAVRYAGAMVFGVLLVGALTPVLGAATVSFALLMLVALAVGRWRKLGQQGPQVGVAALFAYSSFTHAAAPSASFAQLTSIAGLVVLGCAIGVVTNLVLAPPMRYRSANHAVSTLAESLSVLINDIDNGIRAGVPAQDEADEWLYRAEQFPQVVAQTRATVTRTVEMRRFNPRRLLLRRQATFEGHRAIISALERVAEQLRSATRGLTYASSNDATLQHAHEQFLSDCADVLAPVGEASRLLGELNGAEDAEDGSRFAREISSAREAYDRLSDRSAGHQLDSPGEWPVYSSLQTDAARLVEELVEAQYWISHYVPAAASSRT